MSVTKASLLGDTFGSSASGTIPIGGIIMWTGSVAPTGWALCNGNGGVPINELPIPDLRDRFIVGATNGGDNVYPGVGVGQTGGSSDAVVVSHIHTGSTSDPGGHIHSINYQSKRVEDTGSAYVSDLSFRDGDGDGGSENRTSTWVADNIALGPIINAAGDHTHTVTVNPTGDSGTNKNLPPYYALAFIMRVS